jgi:hypothetical protein
MGDQVDHTLGLVSPLPGYLSDRIVVSPTAIHQASSHDMFDALDVISYAWKDIVDTWNGLKLSWAGQASDGADDFMNRLDTLQTNLFGTPKKDANGNDTDEIDKPGVLDRVRDAGVLAAANYDQGETVIWQAFHRFTTTLGGGPAALVHGDGGRPPQNSSDVPQDAKAGPITETYG